MLNWPRKGPVLFYQADTIEISYEDGDCPVCGAEHFTCKGENEFSGTISMFESKKDDPLATFIVKDRVYETYTENGRTYRKLKYPKGARIRPEEARSMGLLGGNNV